MSTSALRRKARAYSRHRDAVLLSMDRARIVELFESQGIPPPRDELVFWGAVHQARTAARNLPMSARSESKRWLLARGWRPTDDGEVPV